MDSIRKEIKEATSSMTSVPKPLKFLRAHYDTLKSIFEKLPPGQNRTTLADVISVLAMTSSKEGARESLKFRLAGSAEDVGTWGQEYTRWAASWSLHYCGSLEARLALADYSSILFDSTPSCLLKCMSYLVCECLQELGGRNWSGIQ